MTHGSELTHLLYDVASIANEARSVREALQQTIARICAHLDWPAGHAYLVDTGDAQVFIESGIWWTERPEQFTEMVRRLRHTRYRKGEGPIGRTTATGLPCWLDADDELTGGDAVEERRRPRIRASFVFPIWVQEHLAGVLEFFTPALQKILLIRLDDEAPPGNATAVRGLRYSRSWSA